MKVATAQQMRAIDRTAIEEWGIPGIVLMENAGKGTVDLILKRFGEVTGRVVTIVAGPGNNGGDGLVIARHLHQAGALPHVILLAPSAKIVGDAATNLRVVERLPIPVSHLLSADDLAEAKRLLGHSFLVVDALLGTGLQRAVSGQYAAVIELINGLGRPVLAVDIPSGLDSDSGRPLGGCVRATVTVTYGLAKIGQIIYPGVNYCGDLHIVDIGIPPLIVEQAAILTELLDKKLVAGMIRPRGGETHKGSYGHLLGIVGSQGKTGAAILAAHGALRSGSGLVSLCVPGRLNTIVECGCYEAMTVPMGSEWFLSIADHAAIQSAVMGKDAILVGPGLGHEQETADLTERLYRQSELPMVVDADGLNHLARVWGEKEAPAGVRVLTPHPGEMARMTGLSTAQVQADRIGIAATFARKNKAVVVLKGAATIIADPDGHIAVNPTGNPSMATGGMGDVLAGVIAGLLGQGLPAWQAACLGVYAHGLAADRLAALNQVRFGILASEVANELPLAFKDIMDQ